MKKYWGSGGISPCYAKYVLEGRGTELYNFNINLLLTDVVGPGIFFLIFKTWNLMHTAGKLNTPGNQTAADQEERRKL
jgi:hypothetical protein